MTERAGRIYIMYGQGGYLTSIGMSRLASLLAKLHPNVPVTTHSWKYPGLIVNDIHRLNPTTAIILVGYSLGANSVTNVSNAIYPREVALAVCYDPSVLGVVQHPRENVKRLLLYHNVDNEPEGHAILRGPQVERTDVSLWHLAICYNEALHQKTELAIKKVLNP